MSLNQLYKVMFDSLDLIKDLLFWTQKAQNQVNRICERQETQSL